MAEMIARARPPQAPPPGRPVVMGGGGQMGSLGGKSTAVEANVGVDADAFARLFGHKTDAEIDSLYQGLVIEKEKSPEAWKVSKDSLPIQKSLAAIKKRGRQPITVDQNGRLDIPEITPEAQIRGSTKEQIIARGGKPAERLVASEKEIAEAGKAFDVEKFMATAPATEVTKYLENKVAATEKLAVAAETPSVKEVHLANAQSLRDAGEASKMARQYDEARLKYLPEEQKRASQESTAKLIQLTAAANASNVQGKLFLEQIRVSKEESKAENIMLKSSLDTYRTTQNAVINAYTKGTSDEKTQLMGIITGATERQITSMSTLKRPELGNDALSFWLSLTNDELSSSLQPGTGKLPTQRTGLVGQVTLGVLGAQKVEPKKDMLFQQRASQIVSFMQTMGKSIDKQTAYKSLDLFTRVYGQTTHTPMMNSYAELMVAVGEALNFDMIELQNLITPPAASTKPLETPQRGGQ